MVTIPALEQKKENETRFERSNKKGNAKTVNVLGLSIYGPTLLFDNG